MSINFGLYDIFASIVPGLLYSFLIGETLKLLGLQSIDLIDVDTFGQSAVVVIVSLLLGNLAGGFTYKYWYRILYRKDTSILALQRIREIHPNVKFQFNNFDGDILFSVIAHHNIQLAEKIERNKVTGIMLQKISFAVFLFGILQIITFVSGHSLINLGSSLLALLLSRMSLTRAGTMERWYYQDIFREALNYGNNLREILSASKQITSRRMNKRGI